MAKLIFLLLLTQAFLGSALTWSLSKDEISEDELSRALQAHRTINFRKVKSGAQPQVLQCERLEMTHRVEFPITEDCSVWKTAKPEKEPDHVNIDIVSYHPSSAPMKIYKCQKVSIDYDVSWQISTNRATIVGQTFSLPTDSECRNSPVHIMDPVLDVSGVSFISTVRRTKEYIKKEAVMTTYYTSTRNILIPEDGSKVPLFAKGDKFKDVRYLWDEIDVRPYETKRKLSCEKTKTMKGSILYYCDSFNALYTLAPNAPIVLIDGINYAQTMTGEFISTFEKPVPKSQIPLKIQTDEISVKLEGEGHMINLLSTGQRHNYYMNKCWHRNQLILGLSDGYVTGPNEMEIMFDMKDSIGVSYPGRGFIVIHQCDRRNISDYIVSDTTIILRDLDDRVLYYDPQSLVATEKKIKTSYLPGKKIPFLDGQVLDYSSGSVSSRSNQDSLLYHYSELSTYDENSKPRWNPSTYQKDLKPKTVIDNATDKILELIQKGAVMVMIYLILIVAITTLIKVFIKSAVNLISPRKSYQKIRIVSAKSDPAINMN